MGDLSNNPQQAIDQNDQVAIPLGPPPPPSLPDLQQTKAPKKTWDKVVVENNPSSSSTKYSGISSFGASKKSETGFVGLSNQGATCYLNSLVQALFMTPELRQMIFQWEYDPSIHVSEEHCIPLQLQRLFARLQLSDHRAVSTKELTKSFGWDQRDAFVQHDVQELCRVLFDALDESFEQSENRLTSSEDNNASSKLTYGRVSNLYKGVMFDYICALDPRHVDPKTNELFASMRQDIFMDIQLVVRDFESVEQSLRNYIKPEHLTGDNKWVCDALSGERIDATKGLAFKSLPYLLTLQLNRFDYDYNTWQRIKLANKMSFPFELDMLPYLDPKFNPEHKEYKYELFAVLIHSGSAIGGHYYCYIKSFENDRWYNFNDSSVTEITEESVKVMYGGSDGDAGKSPYKTYNASTNAYMLIYRLIRSENMNTLSDIPVPESLAKEVLEENEQLAREIKQRERELEIAKIKVYLPKERNVYTGMTGIEVELEKHWKFSQAKQVIYDRISVAEEWPDCFVGKNDIRIREYDYTRRAAGRSLHDKEDMTVRDLGIRTGSLLTVQTKDPDEEWPVEIQKMMVILSPFNPESQSFDIFSTKTIRSDQTLRQLKKEMNAILGDKYPHERMNIISSPGNNVLNQYSEADEDKLIEKELGMRQNDILYVEILDESNGYNSRVVERLHQQEYMINVYYCRPDNQNIFDQHVEIDKRSSVQELKDLIATNIGVPREKFRLLHKMHRVPLAEDIPITQSKDIFDYCQLIVEVGDALKTGEILLQIYLYSNIDPSLNMKKDEEEKSTAEETSVEQKPDEVVQGPQPLENSTADKSSEKTSTSADKGEESSSGLDDWRTLLLMRQKQFAELGKLTVPEDVTVGEFKQLIYTQYFSEDATIDPSLLRVRAKNFVSLGKIFKRDEQKLKESYPEITHGKSIAVQILSEPEQLSEQDIIVRVQRWLPSQWKFLYGSFLRFEVIVNKELHKSATEFKQAIYDQMKSLLFSETLSDAEFDVQQHLGVSKAPNGFEISPKKECAEVALLNWNSLMDRKTKEPLANVFAPPTCIVEDDILLIRDLREEEKYDLEDVKSKAPTSTSGERALHIKVYTKKDEEEEKKKQEETNNEKAPQA